MPQEKLTSILAVTVILATSASAWAKPTECEYDFGHLLRTAFGHQARLQAEKKLYALQKELTAIMQNRLRFVQAKREIVEGKVIPQTELPKVAERQLSVLEGLPLDRFLSENEKLLLRFLPAQQAQAKAALARLQEAQTLKTPLDLTHDLLELESQRSFLEFEVHSSQWELDHSGGKNHNASYILGKSEELLRDIKERIQEIKAALPKAPSEKQLQELRQSAEREANLFKLAALEAIRKNPAGFQAFLQEGFVRVMPDDQFRLYRAEVEGSFHQIDFEASQKRAEIARLQDSLPEIEKRKAQAQMRLAAMLGGAGTAAYLANEYLANREAP